MTNAFARAFSRRTTLALAALAGFAVAMPSAGPAFASDWEPNKPVEMVIMAGSGGGADRLARLFQAIIQEEKLSKMPLIPVNKGGGSGAEALRYMVDKAGDPHIIMATLNSYYTTPLRTDIGVDIEKFTPLARMALDTFVLWVNADSPITTLDEYVAAVKAADGTFKMGGTGTGQEDSLVTTMLEREFGIKFTYVPFDGGVQWPRPQLAVISIPPSTIRPRPWDSTRPARCGRLRLSLRNGSRASPTCRPWPSLVTTWNTPCSAVSWRRPECLRKQQTITLRCWRS
jgi:hypothetical protein